MNIYIDPKLSREAFSAIMRYVREKTEWCIISAPEAADVCVVSLAGVDLQTNGVKVCLVHIGPLELSPDLRSLGVIAVYKMVRKSEEVPPIFTKVCKKAKH